MRITHQMLSRNYLTRMGSNLKNLTSSNEKMASGRKFNKGYENVTDAGKALKTRKLVVENQRYQTVIRDAEGRAAAAEDALRNVNTIMIQAKDRVVEGLNGTMSKEDRQKIATELSKLQDEVFQIMNTKYSDRYLFSAAGNADGSAPFSKTGSGALQYQGVRVDNMTTSIYDGSPQYLAPNGAGVYVPTDIPFNKENYVDIGAGYKMNSDGKTVDSNTAFQDTYSGVECFGYGLNDDNVPVNAYSLLGRMVENLNADNMDGLGLALNAIDDSMEFMLTSITEVGARGTTLTDAMSRLESEYETLLERQNELEGIDLSEEIIHNKSYEMSWMVTLQLGSKILPQTIFDFIR